jgi:hypothetical protein
LFTMKRSADIQPSQVAAEVVAKFPILELYEVRLNHRHILAAIWAWAGVKQADRRSVAQLLAVMGGAAPRSSARKALWPLVRRQLLQVLSSQMIFQGMVFSGDLYRHGIESFNCDGLRMSTGWYLFLVTGLASSRVSGRSIADCRATAEWQC